MWISSEIDRKVKAFFLLPGDFKVLWRRTMVCIMNTWEDRRIKHSGLWNVILGQDIRDIQEETCTVQGGKSTTEWVGKVGRALPQSLS
jgi:hypothetical protein